MSDIDIRIRRSTRHLSDSSIPKYKRVTKGLKVFKGLDLSSISSAVKSEIESTMLEVNNVTKSYELQTFQDYKTISDDDLSKIIQVQLKMCNEIKRLIDA